jgi:hypothetical protein
VLMQNSQTYMIRPPLAVGIGSVAAVHYRAFGLG